MHPAKNGVAGGCIALALALGGCGKIKQSDPQTATKARTAAKRQQAACGSAIAYDRLKAVIFDQALRDHDGNRAQLDALADYSFVRMVNPIVKGWDPAFEITRCQGRLILEMPAGVRRAFAGERRLQADIDYTAQAAADGHGLVYAVTGAEPITARLATFNLTGRSYQPPAAIDQSAASPDETPSDETPPAEIAEAAVPPPRTVAERQPDPAPDRVVRRAAPAPMPTLPTLPAASVRDAGEASVRAFYAALGDGDGEAASARIIPEKRRSRAFSPDAITRFYGRLAEPLRLTDIEPVAPNVYRVTYRYAAGRSKCDGTAIVRTVDRDRQTLIRTIDAGNGC